MNLLEMRTKTLIKMLTESYDKIENLLNEKEMLLKEIKHQDNLLKEMAVQNIDKTFKYIVNSINDLDKAINCIEQTMTGRTSKLNEAIRQIEQAKNKIASNQIKDDYDIDIPED